MRIEYLPGDWFVAADGATVAVLDRAIGPQGVARIWRVIADGGQLADVIQELTAQFGTALNAIPPFSIATLRGDDAHVAVRGELVLRSGGSRTTGRGAVTWREEDIAEPDVIEIDDGPGDGVAGVGGANPDGDRTDAWLPFASGVVLAAGVRIVVRERPARQADDVAPDSEGTPAIASKVAPQIATEPMAVGVTGTSRSTWSESRFERAENDDAREDDARGEDGAGADAGALGEDDVPRAGDREPKAEPGSKEPPGSAERPGSKYTRMLYDETALPDRDEEDRGESEALGDAPDESDEPADAGEDPNASTMLSKRKRRERQAAGLADVADEDEADDDGAHGDEADDDDDGGGRAGGERADDGAGPDEADEGAGIDDDSSDVVRPMPGVPRSRTGFGVLVLSSGERVRLDRPVVIGRRPAPRRFSDTLVHLVEVPSPGQDISRSHLELRPSGTQVIAVDLDSTNGTVLYREGEGPRRMLGESEEIVLDRDVFDLGDGQTVEYLESE